MVLVAFIMIGSTAGYAVFSAPNTYTGNAVDTQQQGIQLVNRRQLSGDETLAVLSAGRVLIEYSYPKECAECETDRINMEIFTQKISQLAVLSEFEGNVTAVRMTGLDGNTVELNGTISEDSLFGLFCDVSTAKPRECLLREIG